AVWTEEGHPFLTTSDEHGLRLPATQELDAGARQCRFVADFNSRSLACLIAVRRDQAWPAIMSKIDTLGVDDQRKWPTRASLAKRGQQCRRDHTLSVIR